MINGELRSKLMNNSRNNKFGWRGNGVTRQIKSSNITLKLRLKMVGRKPVASALGVFLFNECKVKRDVTGSGGEFRRLLPATLEKTSFLLATSLSNVPIFLAKLRHTRALQSKNPPGTESATAVSSHSIRLQYHSLEGPPRFLSLPGPFPYLGHFALNCDDGVSTQISRVFHRSSTLTLQFLDINGPPISLRHLATF